MILTFAVTKPQENGAEHMIKPSASFNSNQTQEQPGMSKNNYPKIYSEVELESIAELGYN